MKPVFYKTTNNFTCFEQCEMLKKSKVYVKKYFQ